MDRCPVGQEPGGVMGWELGVELAGQFEFGRDAAMSDLGLQCTHIEARPRRYIETPFQPFVLEINSCRRRVAAGATKDDGGCSRTT